MGVKSFVQELFFGGALVIGVILLAADASAHGGRGRRRRSGCCKAQRIRLMARPHIEFIEVGDVPSVDVVEGPLGGTGMRVLSADDESGAYTAFCSFPAGWFERVGRLRATG